ncbi:signal peptide peptidase SppA [Bryobacterales bacterium F-183]|nr:signal peptide peptidase SppA [Bryobacterales bacterium F-183]
MKKFILGVLCGLAFAGLAGVIIAFAAIRMGGEKPVAVSDNSVLVLKLDGEIPEKPPVDMPFPFLEQQPSITMLELWSTINRAGDDARIKAILLEPRNVGVGWANLEEIRQQLLKFRKKGKLVYASLHTPGTREYYLATAADKIYIAPEDHIDVKGLRIESSYWKGTLDKVGVQVEIEHAGRFKDFGDQYSRTSMTPETREVLNGFLDQLYGSMVNVIAEGRKKTPDQVRALIDQGPFLAKKAKEFGLVDVLAYNDEVEEQLKGALKLSELKKTSLKTYSKAKLPGAATPKKRIAFLVADGGISGDMNLDPADDVTAPAMVKLMKDIEKDESISGVIFRVNSPGGDALASDLMLHQARILSKKKPMIISMADYAASGGYMISMTGDTVLSYPNTITGSIGVVYGKGNLRGLYDKIGMNKEILTRGRFAAIDSEYVPMDAAAREKLRESILATYDSFLQVVAEGRKQKKEDIAPKAEGRAWTGSQAKQQALVDELGGLDRALEMIKAKAKIDANEKVGIVAYPQRKSFVEQWLQRNQGEEALAPVIDKAVIEKTFKAVFPTAAERSWVRTYMRGGMMSVSPYLIEIR